MRRLQIGKNYQIQCYKHNGKIHRAWDEAVLLDIKKGYLVFGNKKTKVTEAQGYTWRTKEPAIMYFFEDYWFNIIAQLKEDGVYYYCNIATPYIMEDDTIKYIDYDLDLRVFPNGEYKVLDKSEYVYHKKIMNYSENLDMVINNGLEELLDLYSRKVIMFDKTQNEKYYNSYMNFKKKQQNVHYF